MDSGDETRTQSIQQGLSDVDTARRRRVTRRGPAQAGAALTGEIRRTANGTFLRSWPRPSLSTRASRPRTRGSCTRVTAAKPEAAGR